MMGLLKGSMKGRKMFVMVYSMGPLGSPYSYFGAQVTDSPYVVINTTLQSRMGVDALNLLRNDQDFFTAVHSVACPLEDGDVDVPWPCKQASEHLVAYFSEEKSMMSYGTTWGSNSLACRIPHALRIGSQIGQKDGWFAECCSIIGITSPEGKCIYIAAALPKGSGRTALSMNIPTIPGWKVRCVSDDIAWLHRRDDGRLWAINPMAGVYDVAYGTSVKSNSAGLATLTSDALFTNVALTPNNDVWWEGKTDEAPPSLVDWEGKEWTPDCGRNAAHPNSRYTAATSQCPVADPEWENPNGVPISAVIFGSRRKSVYPLIYEASNWEQGILMATCLGKDYKTGVNRQPFAHPYMGYNVNDHAKQWLDFRKQAGYNIPRLFFVNWFRENKDGDILWPGYRENCRILKWVHQRTTNTCDGIKSPIGLIPNLSDLDLRGVRVSTSDVVESLKVDKAEWDVECQEMSKYLSELGADVLEELTQELEVMKQELNFY